MSENIKEYIAQWDPMDFIRSDEAPVDEYDREAYEIFLWFKGHRNATNDEVATITHEIFVDRLEIDPEGFRDECYKRAAAIKAALQKDVKQD
ncbi:MAG: hypothetical protein ABWY71_00255 [Candidatus Saccharimonadales bacterium]